MIKSLESNAKKSIEIAETKKAKEVVNSALKIVFLETKRASESLNKIGILN